MPPNSHEALLQECRDLFRDHLIEAVRRTFDGMDKALSELALKAPNEESRRRFLDARDMALRHRDVIEAQFRRRLMSEFQGRIDKSKQAGRLQSFSLEDMQLVGDDDLNETLSFNEMAAKMRSHCDEEMSALDQRAAVLLGKSALGPDENPFGAKVVADAFKHACQQVDCPLDVRLVFVKSFEKLAMEGIRGTCREVNDLLVANAVLPKIRYGVSRQEEKAKAANEESAASPQKDMFSMLSGMLGGQGPAASTPAAPGLGVGGAPLVQGAQLMGSLTSLQRGDLNALGAAAAELAPILAEAGELKNVLRRLQGTSVAAGMSQMDAMTLEIVSMLFDALFEDPKIPAALKGLIGRLQLPMLKVAIADKAFFSSKAHPARQLLDALGQMGLRLPPDFGSASPLFPKLEVFIDELVEGFQEKLEIFDEVRVQLEALIAKEDERVAGEMQASQRQLDQAESLAVAKAEVQEELRARLRAHTHTPRAIAEFLVQHWIKHLVAVRARDGAGSVAWHAAMETTDQLLWSVQPKPTPEDRKQLMGILAAMLRALRAGIAFARIEDEVASAFFSQLMARHTEFLRPLATAASAKEASGTPEELFDFANAVTVHNPFGEGQVEVSEIDLDFTAQPESALKVEPVEAARPLRPVQMIRLPSAMRVGAWVSVEDPKARSEVHARLHYVSPRKSHFLFVDRRGNKVFECSRSMLANRLALGEVALLDGEPDASLFDRIMEGIFGKLRRPLPKAA